jgi:hypothetical protein
MAKLVVFLLSVTYGNKPHLSGGPTLLHPLLLN